MISTIPKRIIQTAKSHDLPLLERAGVANLKLLNPEFEYMFFDDCQVEDFIDKEFPEYRSLFHSFPVPIQKYDFFRYLAVYRFGGFYFDTDVFLASNVSELLEYGCVFPFEGLTFNRFLREEYGMDWEIGNYAFGAAAGHPFIRAIIDNCIKAQQDMKWIQPMMRSTPRMFRDRVFVLNTTGPLLVSRTLAEYREASEQVKVLFPDNVCDVTCWSRFGKYGVHLMAGGWRKREGIVRRRLYSMWKSWKQEEMFRNALRQGPNRSLEFK